MMDKEFVCCLCGETFKGWGNNPWPLNENEEARCCDSCNGSLVIPARLARMEMAQKFKEDNANG